MGKRILNGLLFVAMVAVCVGLTFYMSGGAVNSMMIYNFSFLGIMVVIYLVGLIGGMLKMNRLGADLDQAGEGLEDYFRNSDKSEKLSVRLESIFHHPYLSRKMKNFLLGMKKSKEGIVDLEEYINEDELDNYIHKRMLEMVPDILTSLGILGTFVGLVWGLKDFEPSNYEAMTTSVTSLVEGIKVAFLTSIYGVSLSVIYTFGVKSEYSALTEALQDFLGKFHGYVMPSAENKSRNLLVAVQKQQTEALAQMAGEFSTQMAQQFTEMITPTFQKMTDTLDGLAHAVTSCQEEAMKEIVHTFLMEMHNSFNMEFQDFQKALESVTKVQRENTQFTQKLYQDMSKEMKAAYAAQEKTMTELLKTMGETQNQYLATAGEIAQENKQIQAKQQEDYRQLADYLRDAEKSSAKFWVACNQTMQKYVESAGDTSDKFGKVGQQCGQLLNSNQKLLETFEEKLREFSEYQKMSYNVMNQLRRMLSDATVVNDEKDLYLVGGRITSLAAQNANKEAMDQVKNLLEEQAEQQKKVLDEMNRNLQDMSRNNQKGRFGLFK